MGTALFVLTFAAVVANLIVTVRLWRMREEDRKASGEALAIPRRGEVAGAEDELDDLAAMLGVERGEVLRLVGEVAGEFAGRKERGGDA